MLRDALAFPRSGDRWKKTLLVGGLLYVLSLLVFPVGFLIYGYLVRCLRSGARDEGTPPPFEDWGRLFVEGLGFVGVQFGYVAAPYLLVLLFVAAVPEPPGEPLRTIAGVGLLAVGLGIFVLGFMLPAAWARSAHEERWTAGFQFRQVAAGAFSTEYLLGVVVALGIVLVIGLLGLVLLLVLVGVFVIFYAQMASFWALGRGYGAAMDVPSPDRTEPADGSVAGQPGE